MNYYAFIFKKPFTGFSYQSPLHAQGVTKVSVTFVCCQIDSAPGGQLPSHLGQRGTGRSESPLLGSFLPCASVFTHHIRDFATVPLYKAQIYFQ